MTLAIVWTHLLETIRRLDRQLTDAACQHGRYCVTDEKIGHRVTR